MTETQSAFARRINRTRSWVTQLKNDGRLVLTADGLVDIEASMARIEATEDPSKAGVAARHEDARSCGGGDDEVEDATAVTGLGTFKEHQTRKMKADADMAEMERDRLAGKLVPTDAADFAMDDLVAAVRSRLENWPDRLAPELYPIATLEETRAYLVDAVETELNALSAQRRRRADELRALNG